LKADQNKLATTRHDSRAIVQYCEMIMAIGWVYGVLILFYIFPRRHMEAVMTANIILVISKLIEHSAGCRAALFVMCEQVRNRVDAL
jgi:hypothetical protein